MLMLPLYWCSHGHAAMQCDDFHGLIACHDLYLKDFLG